MVATFSFYRGNVLHAISPMALTVNKWWNPKVLNVKIINPVECPDWDKSLQSMSEFSFFHSTAWARVLMASYGYTPRYVAIYDKGKLAGLIPFMEIRSVFTRKRGVSLPFSDYSTPVIPDDGFFGSIFKWIVAFGRKSGWRYLEIRGGASIPEYIPASRSYYVHTLRLSENENDMFKRVRNSTKRNVNRALREKVTVKKYNSSEAMSAFYRMNCMTRKKHGLPPQPISFFNSIFDYVISSNKGHIFLAHYRNKIIAGAVYFHMGRKAIYKYGASDPRYLDVRANNLVMWEAIKFYGRTGFESLCFGRTEPENQGLIQFKSGWGAKQETVNYYRYHLLNNKFVISNTKEVILHTRIFKFLPVALLKFIGELAYKHIG
jgi:lipid II:glycine glycyltransferase (peptidoglycan interpeptide bridge formation enzyme)